MACVNESEANYPISLEFLNLHYLRHIMSKRSSKRDNDVITPDRYIAIGNRQSQSGNYPSALVAYDLAVKLAPNYADSYNYRGAFKYAHLGMRIK